MRAKQIVLFPQYDPISNTRFLWASSDSFAPSLGESHPSTMNGNSTDPFLINDSDNPDSASELCTVALRRAVSTPSDP